VGRPQSCSENFDEEKIFWLFWESKHGPGLYSPQACRYSDRAIPVQ
jgi:hypothetical protein